MKRILLGISGLSPQVITETLYCLYQDNRLVDEIHLITTRAGKEVLLSRFLAEGEGAYYRFLEEYDISGDRIQFHPGHIHIIKDDCGREIEDIVTQEDNEYLLKLCLELAWKMTSIDNVAVYFLVAGGRKTMTSCLTLAAQLYGRTQDRMYHVLVSPEFESCRDFWYPPKKSTTIELSNYRGERFYKESRYAQVQLIPVPFVSLRGQLSSTLLAEPHLPGTLLTSLIKDEARVLEISLPEAVITYGGVQLDMHPAHLALFTLFCERKKLCRHGAESSCRGCRECFLSVADVLEQQERLSEIYALISTRQHLDEMSNTGIVNLTPENFYSYKSKIKKELQKTFGPMAAELIIGSVGRKPDTRYGINLPKKKIIITW